jgi:ribulose kinase
MKKKNKSLGEAVAVGSALVGAALGAAAVLLSDKKNQEKLKKTIDEFSEDAATLGKTVKKKVEEFRKTTQKEEKKVVKKVKVVKKTAVKPTGKIYAPLKEK